MGLWHWSQKELLDIWAGSFAHNSSQKTGEWQRWFDRPVRHGWRGKISLARTVFNRQWHHVGKLVQCHKVRCLGPRPKPLMSAKFACRVAVLSFWYCPLSRMARSNQFVFLHVGSRYLPLDPFGASCNEATLSLHALSVSPVPELCDYCTGILLHSHDQSWDSYWHFMGYRCQLLDSHDLCSVAVCQWELRWAHSRVHSASDAQRRAPGDHHRWWCELAACDMVSTSKDMQTCSQC